MSLGTWVWLASVLTFGLCLAALQVATMRWLRREIQADLAELRSALKAALAGVTSAQVIDSARAETDGIRGDPATMAAISAAIGDLEAGHTETADDVRAAMSRAGRRPERDR